MTYEFEKLGKPMNQPSKDMETFPAPEHVTLVRFTSDEVSSYCPVTAQPDFNTVVIEYEPDKMCIESKSLKLYLWTFRDEHIFGEGLANQIALDIFNTAEPFSVRVTLQQNVRGGIQMDAIAEIEREDD